MLSATNHDGPTFHTQSRAAQHNVTEDLTLQPKTNKVTPNITMVTDTPDATPKLLTEDRFQAILQMQKTNPFWKCISKCLSNGEPPKHEADHFLHIKGLLYKHVTDSNQKFLALVMPKAWKCTVLMEAHDKLSHKGATHTYCLVKCQFINHYLPVHMCPRFILSDSGTKFKNQLMEQVLQQLGTDCIFSAPYHPQSNGKLEVFHKYLKPTLKKLCKKDPTNWDKYINQVCTSYRVTPNLTIAETPFFLVYGINQNLPLHQLLELMQQFLGNPESGLPNLEAH